MTHQNPCLQRCHTQGLPLVIKTANINQPLFVLQFLNSCWPLRVFFFCFLQLFCLGFFLGGGGGGGRLDLPILITLTDTLLNISDSFSDINN